MKVGYNGVSVVSQRLGINKHTVRKGKKELLEGIILPEGKIRRKGGGRKKNDCRKRVDCNIIVGIGVLYSRQSYGFQYIMDELDIETDTAKIERTFDFGKLSCYKRPAAKSSICEAKNA
jgi:hypothetical protein